MGKHYPAFILCAIFVAIAVCDGFAPVISHRPRTKTGANEAVQLAAAVAGAEIKTNFLEALDRPYDLNTRSKTRTQLLNDVIDGGGGLQNPGSRETFMSVAQGMWKVIYAPHMTIMFGLFQGEVSVQYDLRKDGTTTSHAKYRFPVFNLYGYLSVSGTYDSVNNQVCRVDFDEAWMRSFDPESSDRGPYPEIGSVPDSVSKFLIRNIGRALFIEPFAVFPVTYLDDDLIVFDFELLGTRICARKES